MHLMSTPLTLYMRDVHNMLATGWSNESSAEDMKLLMGNDSVMMMSSEEECWTVIQLSVPEEEKKMVLLFRVKQAWTCTMWKKKTEVRHGMASVTKCSN